MLETFMHFYPGWQMESNGSWSLRSSSLQSAAWIQPCDWFCACYMQHLLLCVVIWRKPGKLNTHFSLMTSYQPKVCDIQNFTLLQALLLSNDLSLSQGRIKVWAGNLGSKYLLIWFFFFFSQTHAENYVRLQYIRIATLMHGVFSHISNYTLLKAYGRI